MHLGNKRVTSQILKMKHGPLSFTYVRHPLVSPFLVIPVRQLQATDSSDIQFPIAVLYMYMPSDSNISILSSTCIMAGEGESTAAQAAWRIHLIRTTICESAAPSLLVTIAQLDKLSFQTAVQYIWGAPDISVFDVERHGSRAIEERLAAVKSAVRYQCSAPRCILHESF